mmetsp:Transcript_44175/g.172205  ORF Transcript_44175/g.172205 Transcript_44175/m.172205 type:complete len:90 (-) Transcript_44175:74-343(-)
MGIDSLVFLPSLVSLRLKGGPSGSAKLDLEHKPIGPRIAHGEETKTVAPRDKRNMPEEYANREIDTITSKSPWIPQKDHGWRNRDVKDG